MLVFRERTTSATFISPKLEAKARTAVWREARAATVRADLSIIILLVVFGFVKRGAGSQLRDDNASGSEREREPENEKKKKKKKKTLTAPKKAEAHHVQFTKCRKTVPKHQVVERVGGMRESRVSERASESLRTNWVRKGVKVTD